MTRTKARRMSVSEFETGLARPGARDVFRDDELVGLPAPVQRYFRAAIAPGTPLALAARLEMQGSIKIGGRWLPFRATEVLAPHRSFLWSARVSGGLFAGSDQYVVSAQMERWGDPNNTGTWALHSFGFEATARATFGGVSIPSQGRVGWFPRTERWTGGEFFRFALTELRLVLA